MTPMRQIHWTGHPFVDGGLAALAAGAGASSLGELKAEHLDQACKKLSRTLLSHQALGLGIDGKAFVKGPLSQLFPNSELVNPSNQLRNSRHDRGATSRGMPNSSPKRT